VDKNKRIEMAGIAAKGVYAVAAILVLYQHADDNTPIPIEKIAKEANVPKNFLEQILISLKKHCILKNIRGAHGGYLFAKDPSQITIMDIIQSVETQCCEDVCRTDNPILRMFWKDFRSHMQTFLSQPITRFSDYIQRLANENMYYI